VAALTWFGTETESNNWLTLNETSPGADATSATGWIVSTGSTNHSEISSGQERTASTFTGTTVPDGTVDSALGDSYRTVNTYNGSFANANWTFNFYVIGVTQSGAQDGRIRFRLFRGANADGSGATEITAAQQQGSLVTNLGTTQVNSTLVLNPGAVTVTSEYLFAQVAWERTGAGGMTSTNVRMRHGATATTIVSADFTPTATSLLIPRNDREYVAGAADFDPWTVRGWQG
jgi:hypothetical protein